MPVSQMQRVKIFTHNSHKASLIKDLQDLEIVHINNLNEEHESSEELQVDSEIRAKTRILQSDLSRLDSSIKYLSNFEEKKGLLSGFLGTGRPVFTRQEYLKALEGLKEDDWRKIVEECESLQEQVSRLASRENRLASERESLASWSGLDAPVENLRDTEKTAIRVGSVPQSTYDNLLSEAKEYNIYIENVGSSRNEVNLVVIYLKDDEQDIIQLLTRHGFSSTSLPISSGTIPERLKAIEQEISNIAREREKIAQRSRELAQHRTKLMLVYDHFLELLNQESIREYFLNTDHTFVIDGWVRKRDVKKLEEQLSRKYEEIDIIVSDPSDDDEPPVDLTNPKLASPYEMVTKLYSLPRYREIDPTSLLAPFLTLGFAICLTDAGYGIFVLIVSLIGLWKISRNNKLLSILAISGFLTVVVGALTGGWFGIPPEKLPGFLLKIRIIDPNTQQLLFLGLIVALGYIQVWFGYVVKSYICIKERNWVEAFANQIPWSLTMILAPLLILVSMGRISAPASVGTILKAVIGLSLLSILIFSGREIKNPAGRIGTGFFELYSRITGTFGDTLSYMRLFALGLATGIIASSINVIAGMLWSNPVGKIGTILVLIAGHPFNIVINSLGGFIHSTRLQFVEFFTKFYEGGGREFRPFKREHVYVTVLDMERSK